MPFGRGYFMMQTCYCCSGKLFEECCKPILDGVRKASTAEELMRSRYSAYATASVEYILRTTHMSTRKLYDLTTIRIGLPQVNGCDFKLFLPKRVNQKIQKALLNLKQPTKLPTIKRFYTTSILSF